MTVTLSRWEKAPYYFLSSDPPDRVVEALQNELSYQPKGYEYTDKFKNGEWDGFVNLFKQSKNGNWYFGVGHLPKVIEVLDMFDISYQIEGAIWPGRGQKEYSWDTIKELRDYQRDAVEKALRYGHGVIALPTGSGKTLLGIWLIKELSRSAIVTCDKKEVADQWMERLADILGITPAKYYGGDRETDRDVMVALYQSIYMDGEVRDDAQLDDYDILIADECHNVAARTFNEIVMNTTAKYRYGFSATPERDDRKMPEIISGLGPIIEDLSPPSLIRDGFLAVPEWKLLKSPSSGGSYRQWQDEYKEEIVTNRGRNELIADTVADLETPCLITTERINHGERLSNLIDDAAFVHGNATGREKNIQMFRDGELPVLIATRGIVGEGFDCPAIRSFVVAGGLKSEVSTLQQVGRGMRYGETGEVTIVDFKDSGRWIGKHSEERIRTYRRYYQDYGP